MAITVDIDVFPSNVVELEVFPGGIVYRPITNEDNPDPVYKEFTYTGDNLTLINTWDTEDKNIFLFSTQLTYLGDNLVEKVVTDHVTEEIRTTIYVYSGENLISYSEVIS
jgi:hypothetical protein